MVINKYFNLGERMKTFKEFKVYLEDVGDDDSGASDIPLDDSGGDDEDPENNSPKVKSKKNKIKEDVPKPTGDLKKACWKGYAAVGMKMKNGKKVPNCVPVK